MMIMLTSFTAKCVLPLKPNYSFFAPLIFTPDGTLIDSENVSEQHEDVSLNAGQEVLLSCTPNYFKLFSAHKTVRAKCKEDTILCKYFDKINVTFCPLLEVMSSIGLIDYFQSLCCHL